MERTGDQCGGRRCHCWGGWRRGKWSAQSKCMLFSVFELPIKLLSRILLLFIHICRWEMLELSWERGRRIDQLEGRGQRWALRIIEPFLRISFFGLLLSVCNWHHKDNEINPKHQNYWPAVFNPVILSVVCAVLCIRLPEPVSPVLSAWQIVM